MSARGNTATQDFERRRATLFDVLKKNETAIEKVATKHLGVDRLMNLVYGELRKTPKLVMCTPSSVAASVWQAARLGLEIGGVLGRCYLVPYLRSPKDGSAPYHECQFILGYKGMIELAYRSPTVMSVNARGVFQGDGWRWKEGIDQVIEHMPRGTTDPEKLTHAWAVVKLRNGGVKATVLTRSEIEHARQYSAAAQDPAAPWVRFYTPMAMKTAVRQNFKFAPCSIEMALAVAWDEMAEAGFPAEEMLDEPLVGVEAEAEPVRSAPQEPVEASPAEGVAIVPVRPKGRLSRIVDRNRKPPRAANGSGLPHIVMPDGEAWQPDPNDPHPFAPRKP